MLAINQGLFNSPALLFINLLEPLVEQYLGPISRTLPQMLRHAAKDLLVQHYQQIIHVFRLLLDQYHVPAGLQPNI